MKKLLAGLLIVAAGATAFFLLRKKDDTIIDREKVEFIVGKWKNASNEPVNDSTKFYLNYEFLPDGKLLRSANDSSRADTLHYEWDKNKALVLKPVKGDSVLTTYFLRNSSPDSLQLQPKDSGSTILLSRIK
jgi:hypothetical protein